MSNARRSTRLAGMTVALLLAAFTSAAAQEQLSVEMQVSQLSVVNDIADATFKIVVTNEEATPLVAAWLVFDDGFEVSVGDVPAQGSAASEPATRSFDLSQHVRSRNVPLPAKLKYTVGGNAAEQALNVVLRLEE